MDSSGRNLNFWPRAVRGEVSEEEWKEFVKVGFKMSIDIKLLN